MPEHPKEEEDVIFKNGNEIQSINSRALNAYPELKKMQDLKCWWCYFKFRVKKRVINGREFKRIYIFICQPSMSMKASLAINCKA